MVFSDWGGTGFEFYYCGLMYGKPGAEAGEVWGRVGGGVARSVIFHPNLRELLS